MRDAKFYFFLTHVLNFAASRDAIIFSFFEKILEIKN